MTPPRTTPEAEASTKRLEALLEKAKSYVMTDKEREAQRQSWVRGEMAMGNDADEARERARLAKERT